MEMPKYGFDARLANRQGFIGDVDAIFKDLHAAIACRVVDRGWLEQQDFKPSTTLQVFYSLVSEGRVGAVLVGENDCRLIAA